ncbi:MAG: hypothetical protein A2163_10975 [Actinobacteria bacterium RBG_13_35_12]|nr:MAG: hypothetical protein A2163_10975 [Actinobacteria bacterium RBG_13_35_12]
MCVILQSAERLRESKGKLKYDILRIRPHRSNTFDLMTFRDFNITEVEDDLGNKKKIKCNERYYVPSEITWLLKSLGYKKIDIFGAKLGAFSRNDQLTTEDFEMLVIAEK